MEASALAGLAVGGGVAVVSAYVGWAMAWPSAQPWGRGLWRGPPGSREIALTYDDGPSDATPAILETLAEHRVPATFFMCGQNVARRPELARAVADAGHEIGNHSDGHPYLPLCSAARVRRELVAAQRRIEEHTGRTARFFRPPFGLRAPALPAVLAELGLTCVMWTVIGNDWKLPADAIAERVLSRVGDGGIICLHDGDRARAGARRDATVEATRRIVPALLERGYAFVGLERMAGTP